MTSCVRRALLVIGLSVAVALAPMGASALPELPRPTLSEVPVDSWSAELTGRVTAEAWVLIEGETGQVIAGGDHLTRRPVASTIKLLTALSVVERAAPEDLVVVGDEVLVGEGAGVGLAPGDQWTVGELVDALIARSGNDAAEALALHVGGTREGFLDLMREDARALGLEDVVITSPSGLDDGNLLSPLDLATLGAAALADDWLREVAGSWSVTLPGLGAVESRNTLLWEYPGATGVKTGFTEAAGSSVVGSARVSGRELIAVVLASADDRSRFDDVEVLLDHGFGATSTQRLGSTLGLRVGGGTIEWALGPTLVTLPTGSVAELALSVPPRPVEGELVVEVMVDGEAMGAVRAEPIGWPDPHDAAGARLGRALADGVYAALRTATAGQQLG